MRSERTEAPPKRRQRDDKQKGRSRRAPLLVSFGLRSDSAKRIGSTAADHGSHIHMRSMRVSPFIFQSWRFKR